MGCCSAKVNEVNLQQREIVIRRRLSLGDLSEDDPDDVRRTSNFEEDRSLLILLSDQKLADFVNGGEVMMRPREGGAGQQPSPSKEMCKMMSIGSTTDKMLQRAASFASKSILVDGIDTLATEIGYVCKKGKKPESPNQDSFVVVRVQGEFSMYGVFDGHGRHGHDVSNFVKDNLPKLLLSSSNMLANPEESLLMAFSKMHRLIVHATDSKTIDCTRSGTTVSILLHDMMANALHVAHVGDSRVVLGRILPSPKGGKQQWVAFDLTQDHKPNAPAEKDRIEKAGGKVVHDGGWNYRVYSTNGTRGPGLNMSRAMGDLGGYYNAGISPVPDVNSYIVGSASPSHHPSAAAKKNMVSSLQGGPQNASSSGGLEEVCTISSDASVRSYVLSASDRFALVCSDGIWEFLSSQEVVEIVAQFGPDRAMEAAEHLAKVAWEAWEREMQGLVVDDITVVLVFFPLNVEIEAALAQECIPEVS